MIGLPDGFILSYLLSDYFALGSSVLGLSCLLVIGLYINTALRQVS